MLKAADEVAMEANHTVDLEAELEAKEEREFQQLCEAAIVASMEYTSPLPFSGSDALPQAASPAIDQASTWDMSLSLPASLPVAPASQLPQSCPMNSLTQVTAMYKRPIITTQLNPT